MTQDQPKVIDAARWQDIEDETQIDPAKLGYVLAWPYRISEQLSAYVAEANPAHGKMVWGGNNPSTRTVLALTEA